jgi:hypothetical protein
MDDPAQPESVAVLVARLAGTLIDLGLPIGAARPGAAS